MSNIFYSWQTDSTPKHNKYFIKSCLEIVIQKLNKGLDIEESLRIDHDTKDIPGIPDIVNTIFEKIDESLIFVADITFVAKTGAGKNIPNPNVLIELGYAIKSRSSSQIILIMNGAFGNPDEGLPFDLAHKRWPIVYTLSEGSTKEDIENQRTHMVTSLLNAVRLILQAKAIEPLPVIVLNPSQENIERVVMYSDPKADWGHQSIGGKIVVRYKGDVNLRFEINYHSNEGIQQEDFKEEWANRHPDPSATGYWCNLYYNQTLIERFILVSVDGGRALLPIPKKGKDFAHLDQVLPLDYKIAEIHDTTGTLSQYMARSRLTIYNEDM